MVGGEDVAWQLVIEMWTKTSQDNSPSKEHSTTPDSQKTDK